MAKESGLGMTVSVDDSGGTLKDISNDVASITFSTPQGLIEVTGVDKSAMERIIGLSDGNVQITSAGFNDAADHLFAVFKTRTGTRTVTIAHSGNTLSMEMLVEDVSYSLSGGNLVTTATLQLQSGTVPAWT